MMTLQFVLIFSFELSPLLIPITIVILILYCISEKKFYLFTISHLVVASRFITIDWTAL